VIDEGIQDGERRAFVGRPAEYISAEYERRDLEV
jgi:hypothetical protein